MLPGWQRQPSLPLLTAGTHATHWAVCTPIQPDRGVLTSVCWEVDLWMIRGLCVWISSWNSERVDDSPVRRCDSQLLVFQARHLRFQLKGSVESFFSPFPTTEACLTKHKLVWWIMNDYEWTWWRDIRTVEAETVAALKAGEDCWRENADSVNSSLSYDCADAKVRLMLFSFTKYCFLHTFTWNYLFINAGWFPDKGATCYQSYW